MSATVGSPNVTNTQNTESAQQHNESTPISEIEGSGFLKRKAQSPLPTPEEESAPKRHKADENIEPRNGAVDISTGTPPVPFKEEESREDAAQDRESSQTESPVNRSRDEPRKPSISSPDRRKSYSQEERKRGQRLFGGLLSTLSQKTTGSQQKKRLEIERRQHERAHQQKIEDDKRRADRLAKLSETRKIEQVKFDEQVMRTRHSNMLAVAHSLQTRSEPRLYYSPWERTPEQEEKIKGQIQDATDNIDKEVRDFKRQKEKRLKDLGVQSQPAMPDSTVGENRSERSDHTPVEHSSRPSSKHAHEKDHDEKDVMVETEEDTVIY